MKQSIRTLTALLLSFVLILSCMAGCAQPGTDPSGQPADTTESTKTGATTPGVVIKETDPPETLPVPVEQEETTQFPEAFELLTYLNVLTADDAAAYAEKLTGAQAVRALTAMGLANCGIDSNAETVTGTAFLAAAMKLLGYNIADETKMLAAAEKIHLTRGFWKFDAAAALSVEQAANILLSALQSYTVDAAGVSTGVKLSASMGVEHTVLTEYDEPFNRPGSTWVSASTGASVTGEYTAIPIAVFGTTANYCDVMSAVGFDKDDPDYDNHTPKYFRLSVDGGQLSEKFYKHHNGDAANPHSGCENDFTGGQDATLELYAIEDYEFRMVIMNTFLAVSDPYTGLTVYGFERSEYGPYTEDTRPAYGVYIAHHYWNAYGMGNGYEIVGPATVIKGTLTEGNVLTTTIDGVAYENGQSYGYGKKLTTAPANAGKELYFYLDRYGFMLGCSTDPVE